jgi:uncharacterized protein (DUF1499 family)
MNLRNMMFLYFLPFLIDYVYCFSNSLLTKYKLHNNIYQSLSMKSKSNDDTKLFSSIRKVLGPVIGFYSVMLAPIYGIGLFGPLGSMTDFSTLKNRGLPGMIANEYIVAPKGFSSARVNEIASEYSISADELSQAVDKVISRQPRITYITEDSLTKRKEYVQRSLIFRFPDVITFQFIPLEKEKSTLAVHSYSIYGSSDLGVNGNRVRSWLSELENDIESN